MVKKFVNSFMVVMIIIASVFIVITVTARVFHLEYFIVNGSSMEPTFHQNQFVLYKKSVGLHRGDIVLLNKPPEWITKEYPDKKILLKRIVGLPGDIVIGNNKTLTVNGTKISLPPGCVLPSTKQILKDNQFFIVGDNSKSSMDSRYHMCNEDDFIPIERKDIITAIKTVWKV